MPTNVTFIEVQRFSFTRDEVNDMKMTKKAWADTNTFQQAALWLHSTGSSSSTKTPQKEKGKQVARAPSLVAASATYALHICRTLRNYKKACDADILNKDRSWQQVHDSWDWGPLMEDDVTDNDDDEEPDDDDD